MSKNPSTLSVVFVLLLGILAFLVAGCAQATVVTPEPTTVTIAGSTAMRPVLAELTDQFSQQHPDVLFSIQGGGSTLGETWVAEGQVDLAGSTLPPSPAQEAAAQERGLFRVPIALDGLAIVVHASNPVSELALFQLRNLYSGRFLDWKEVEGRPGEVLLVSREDGSGSRIFFEERVMGEERVSLTAVVMPSSGDVVAYVADHPGAIGYVSRAYVIDLLNASEPSEEPGGGEHGPADVKVLALEGLLPTQENLAAQSYPLTRPLYLVTRGEPQGQVRQFIDFVLSPQGQGIVAAYHVPIR